MSRWLWLMILAVCGVSLAHAQTETRAPLTADNVTQFAPVQWIPFDPVRESLLVERGWFTMSADGGLIATVRRDGGLVIWDSNDGTLRETFTVQTDGIDTAVIDARFDDAGARVASLHTADGTRYQVAVHPIGAETVVFDYPHGLGMPVRIWFDADDAESLWVEAQPDPYQSPAGDHLVARLAIAPHEAEPLVLPSAPEKDSESFVRIGRIPAPLAITATPEGLVRLWDLQNGEVRAQVQLEDVPVFGRIVETSGRWFAWRDQTSQALHLLDFESGENRLVAEIGGEYIQAMLLPPDASVILGVHLGDSPTVTAWLSADGQRVELGAYREECSGVPDMVALSEDGTRLVIGCDAGLEIWQIK